jgi:hypothetical protein
MGLRIIGAGFGRTGTLSLKVALEQLGFVKCHHMQEVVRSRAQVDAWYALSRGDAVDWDRVFEGFQAACDWPSSAYWEPLARQYPDALVILTVRDPQRWYESASTTIYQASSGIPGWITAISPRIRYLREMIFATIWNGVFGGRFEDREHALQVFREHTERVKRVVPPDRLLVFEAKEGWEPLCAFLGVPVPDGPYPHVNEAVSMKRAIVVLRVLRWLPLALVAALALFLTTLAR